MGALFEVDDLHVTYPAPGREVPVVAGVTFAIDAGELLAVVGESGSGKSTTAMAVVGLTTPRSVKVGGSVRFRGQEILGAPEATLRRIRGREIGVVFQDALSALNPVQRVGSQIVEQIRAHDKVSRAAGRARALDLLARVGIPDPRRRLESYPHQLSGGMRQRVMIALALSCAPSLLIADEPTTGLDVTVQMQILTQIDELRRAFGLAVLLITHDLGVVAEVADRVAVMYGGRFVETGSVPQIFDDPLHPYTWGLLGSMPKLDRARARRLMAIPGQSPAPDALPIGCVFAPRCPHRFEDCDEPPLLATAGGPPGRLERCWLPMERRRALRVVDGEVGLASPREMAGERVVGS